MKNVIAFLAALLALNVAMAATVDENGRDAGKDVKPLKRLSHEDAKALEIKQAKHEREIRRINSEYRGTQKTPGVYLSADDKSGASFVYQETNGTHRSLSAQEVSNLSQTTIEKAAEIACSLKIKPNSVDISIGFISGTWEISELCKGKK